METRRQMTCKDCIHVRLLPLYSHAKILKGIMYVCLYFEEPSKAIVTKLTAFGPQCNRFRAREYAMEDIQEILNNYPKEQQKISELLTTADQMQIVWNSETEWELKKI